MKIKDKAGEQIIFKAIDVMFSDYEKPIRELREQNFQTLLSSSQHADELFFKNFDVIVDLVKVFLTVSGSILIAKYTLPSTIFPPIVGHMSVEGVTGYLSFILLLLVMLRTYATKKLSERSYELVSIQTKQIGEASARYIENLRTATEKLTVLIQAYTGK